MEAVRIGDLIYGRKKILNRKKKQNASKHDSQSAKQTKLQRNYFAVNKFPLSFNFFLFAAWITIAFVAVWLGLSDADNPTILFCSRHLVFTPF